MVTTKGGCRHAVSIFGSLTGLGGDPLIFDDPLNAADAYSDSTRQRVNGLVRLALARQDDKKTGAAIIAMQRLHSDDPCGSLLAEPGHDWTVLTLAAVAEGNEVIQIGEDKYYQRRAGEPLHEEREPISVLERIKSQVGSAVFGAHYQQSPAPRDGFIFKRAWIRLVDAPPPRTSASMIVQSWDTAIKTGQDNDYSACSTVMFHDKRFYVLDVWRGRLDFPELVKFAKSRAQIRPTRIVVEDSGLGTELVKELKSVGLPAVPVKSRCNKLARMKAQAVKFEGESVSIVQRAWRPRI